MKNSIRKAMEIVCLINQTIVQFILFGLRKFSSVSGLISFLSNLKLKLI